MKNKNLIKLFGLTILLSSSYIISFKTYGHAYLKRKANEKTEMTPKINADYGKRNDWQDIWIHVDFSGLVSQRPEAHDLTQKIKLNVIHKAKKVLSELYKVRRIKSITLNQKMCSDYKIPVNSYGPKNPVEPDLIIFVNYDKTGDYRKYRIGASAIHCYQDFDTNRPIVGLVTYRYTVNVKTPIDEDNLVWLTLHEISHVLLFNEDLYTGFIDENLRTIPYKDIIHEEKNKFNQKISYVKTPNVMRIAKKHFKCNKLKGIPLEYNGRETATGGHWSKRVLNTDYMIGRSHGENLISPFTLAFFEDSGCYKVDYSKSSIYFWGKNKDCDFLEKNCVKSSTTIKSLRHSLIELMKKHNTKEEKTKKKYRNSMEGESEQGAENVHMQSSLIKVETIFKKEFCEEINQPVCSMHNWFRGFCGARL